MTIDEIMSAEIPKGIYFWALSCIRHRISKRSGREWEDPIVHSLCVAFTALYALAGGGQPLCEVASCVYVSQVVREQAIRDVLAVVDKMHMEKGHVLFDAEKWDELKHRIQTER